MFCVAFLSYRLLLLTGKGDTKNKLKKQHNNGKLVHNVQSAKRKNHPGKITGTEQCNERTPNLRLRRNRQSVDTDEEIETFRANGTSETEENSSGSSGLDLSHEKLPLLDTDYENDLANETRDFKEFSETLSSHVNHEDLVDSNQKVTCCEDNGRDCIDAVCDIDPIELPRIGDDESANGRSKKRISFESVDAHWEVSNTECSPIVAVPQSSSVSKHRKHDEANGGIFDNGITTIDNAVITRKQSEDIKQWIKGDKDELDSNSEDGEISFKCSPVKLKESPVNSLNFHCDCGHDFTRRSSLTIHKRSSKCPLNGWNLVAPGDTPSSESVSGGNLEVKPAIQKIMPRSRRASLPVTAAHSGAVQNCLPLKEVVPPQSKTLRARRSAGACKQDRVETQDNDAVSATMEEDAQMSIADLLDSLSSTDENTVSRKSKKRTRSVSDAENSSETTTSKKSRISATAGELTDPKKEKRTDRLKSQRKNQNDVDQESKSKDTEVKSDEASKPDAAADTNVGKQYTQMVEGHSSSAVAGTPQETGKVAKRRGRPPTKKLLPSDTMSDNVQLDGSSESPENEEVGAAQTPGSSDKRSASVEAQGSAVESVPPKMKRGRRPKSTASSNSEPTGVKQESTTDDSFGISTERSRKVFKVPKRRRTEQFVKKSLARARANLTNKENKLDGKIKRVQCGSCGGIYSQCGSVRRHQENSKCSGADYKYVFVDKIDKPEKERKFVCSCGKAFTQSSSMQRHQKNSDCPFISAGVFKTGSSQKPGRRRKSSMVTGSVDGTTDNDNRKENVQIATDASEPESTQQSKSGRRRKSSMVLASVDGTADSGSQKENVPTTTDASEPESAQQSKTGASALTTTTRSKNSISSDEHNEPEIGKRVDYSLGTSYICSCKLTFKFHGSIRRHQKHSKCIGMRKIVKGQDGKSSSTSTNEEVQKDTQTINEKENTGMDLNGSSIEEMSIKKESSSSQEDFENTASVLVTKKRRISAGSKNRLTGDVSAAKAVGSSKKTKRMNKQPIDTDHSFENDTQIKRKMKLGVSARGKKRLSGSGSEDKTIDSNKKSKRRSTKLSDREMNDDSEDDAQERKRKAHSGELVAYFPCPCGRKYRHKRDLYTHQKRSATCPIIARLTKPVLFKSSEIKAERLKRRRADKEQPSSSSSSEEEESSSSDEESDDSDDVDNTSEESTDETDESEAEEADFEKPKNTTAKRSAQRKKHGNVEVSESGDEIHGKNTAESPEHDTKRETTTKSTDTKKSKVASPKKSKISSKQSAAKTSETSRKSRTSLNDGNTTDNAQVNSENVVDTKNTSDTTQSRSVVKAENKEPVGRRKRTSPDVDTCIQCKCGSRFTRVASLNRHWRQNCTMASESDKDRIVQKIKKTLPKTRVMIRRKDSKVVSKKIKSKARTLVLKAKNLATKNAKKKLMAAIKLEKRKIKVKKMEEVNRKKKRNLNFMTGFSNPSDPPGRYPCPCGKTYKYRRDLQTHQRKSESCPKTAWISETKIKEYGQAPECLEKSMSLIRKWQKRRESVVTDASPSKGSKRRSSLVIVKEEGSDMSDFTDSCLSPKKKKINNTKSNKNKVDNAKVPNPKKRNIVESIAKNLAQRRGDSSKIRKRSVRKHDDIQEVYPCSCGKQYTHREDVHRHLSRSLCETTVYMCKMLAVGGDKNVERNEASKTCGLGGDKNFEGKENGKFLGVRRDKKVEGNGGSKTCGLGGDKKVEVEETGKIHGVRRDRKVEGDKASKTCGLGGDKKVEVEETGKIHGVRRDRKVEGDKASKTCGLGGDKKVEVKETGNILGVGAAGKEHKVKVKEEEKRKRAISDPFMETANMIGLDLVAEYVRNDVLKKEDQVAVIYKTKHGMRKPVKRLVHMHKLFECVCGKKFKHRASLSTHHRRSKGCAEVMRKTKETKVSAPVEKSPDLEQPKPKDDVEKVSNAPEKGSELTGTKSLDTNVSAPEEKSPDLEQLKPKDDVEKVSNAPEKGSELTGTKSGSDSDTIICNNSDQRAEKESDEEGLETKETSNQKHVGKYGVKKIQSATNIVSKNLVKKSRDAVSAATKRRIKERMHGPYTCPCGKEYTLVRALQRHQRKSVSCPKTAWKILSVPTKRKSPRELIPRDTNNNGATTSEDDERNSFTEIVNKPARPLVSEGKIQSIDESKLRTFKSTGIM